MNSKVFIGWIRDFNRQMRTTFVWTSRPPPLLLLPPPPSSKAWLLIDNKLNNATHAYPDHRGSNSKDLARHLGRRLQVSRIWNFSVAMQGIVPSTKRQKLPANCMRCRYCSCHFRWCPYWSSRKGSQRSTWQGKLRRRRPSPGSFHISHPSKSWSSCFFMARVAEFIQAIHASSSRRWVRFVDVTHIAGLIPT